MQNQIVKEQFNKQADSFANWSVGKNIEYLNAYFDFCDIQPSDKLLDVACGPGDFTVFVANRISEARGIDISDNEIQIANNLIQKIGLSNTEFHCSDVENLPYTNDSFSIVVCKSAFHHFQNPELVFREMHRCCQAGGKVSIQDIVAYKDEYVNDFFEALDKFIDISHSRVLREDEFDNLYNDNSNKIKNRLRIDVDLNWPEYLAHAVQDRDSLIEIEKLITDGQTDKRLADYLFIENGIQYFKRPVYLILGIK